ncbi:hypothetical protein UA08_08882 [Talaromyces atroroseus]|uniref:Transcription factor domain-containing protein n=1 Tax=Talaromyces atroroseus TaxID=1441469 RepID=A0A225A7Q5_TALAT|nr:hypothetical protein UA08_08882 [Talaromyces atroroseus]OKL55860.1 hypothetical protein UA08_08882 [Talaromyces atroroseus]
MSSVHSLDIRGPPRKKMRKGTKSCTEYRPDICNECHARGFTCIDQEYGTLDPKVKGVLSGEQPYSLRERVTQLESVVRDILQRMEQTSPSVSASPVQPHHHEDHPTKPSDVPMPPCTKIPSSEENTSTSKSLDAPITENDHIESAPVLQLFNNNVVSRTEGATSRSQDAAAIKDISPKAIAARNELAKLIPPRGDLIRIRNLVSHWWSAWIYFFPELRNSCTSSLVGNNNIFEIPDSPGEVAKFLICHLMSIEQLPVDFDFASLEVPFDVQEYTDRCITAIDHFIINDEDLSSTLPGLEAMALLSKWYSNLGRPRKAWLMNRRAIELGQLAGLHISTAREPHPNDKLYYRRLKLWTILGLNDRFLCLILGLPSGIADKYFRPQVERRLKMETSHLDTYCLRLCLILGPMIDRNQDDPADMSIDETLRLEQELETQAGAMPERFWNSQIPDSKLSMYEVTERLVLPFIYHFTRATLHLPFMLKSHSDPRYRYSQETALKSARNALLSYNKLRSWDLMNPFICRMIDFQVFSMAMLIIINILGYSQESPNYSPEQDERDWALVDQTTEVLRHAASEPAGTVAAQSLIIIEGLSTNVGNIDPTMSCKVSVPYFGVITVSPGKKRFKGRSDRPTPNSVPGGPTLNPVSNNNPNPSSAQPSPFQIYTPPLSNTSESNGTISSSSSSYTNYTPPLLDDSRVHLENIFSLPNAGMMDQNIFTGFGADSQNLGLWSNMNLDLDLDQGWNLDWTNGAMM